MTEEHTSLKVDSSVVQDGYGYRDVDTYVKMPDGSEWLFRTYREYETGAEVKCEPRFSPGPDDEFGDEGALTEPPEVRAAYEAEMPRIRQLLEPTVTTMAELHGLSITAAAPMLSSSLVFRLRPSEPEPTIQITDDAVIFRGQRITDDAEQIQAFRDFVAGIVPRTKIPLMISTMYDGLKPASLFDAMEVEPMVWCEEAGSLVPESDGGGGSPTAISVRAHYWTGGVDTLADFLYDASEPGDRERAQRAADQYAASIGTVIMQADPTLPYTYVLNKDQLESIEEALKND